MKYTLPILALVASAYCAPVPQPATTLDGVVARTLALSQAITDHLGASKRSGEQQGGPTFFDAGNPATPAPATSVNAASSSDPPSLSEIGGEVGATLGTVLKPIVDPLLDLTNGLGLTKRGVQPTALPPNPPAFGKPTPHNPNPNTGLVPNIFGPKPKVPKSGPTMSGDGSVHRTPAGDDEPLLSLSINLKERANEIVKRVGGFAAVVLKNGLVGASTESLAAGSRKRADKRDGGFAAVVLENGLVATANERAN